VNTTARRATPIESRLRENCTSGSVGRAEVADYQSAASPDPTPAGDCGVVAGKGRTLSMAEESVVLVPVAVIAAIPLHAGSLRGGDGEVR
jgi:hypothetical protein